MRLYLIEILHQTTTLLGLLHGLFRCILLKFYIKPQHRPRNSKVCRVVSYWNSTSNHNFNTVMVAVVTLYLIEILHQTTTTADTGADYLWLYLIEILHQTTTWQLYANHPSELYLIEILHQTTTSHIFYWWLHSCILLKFYIKPQPWLS